MKKRQFLRTLAWVKSRGLSYFRYCLFFFFNDTVFLAPLKYFATNVHESMHAIAAVLTGGKVHDYAVNADYSGYVISSGGIGTIISPAGYVGVALISGFLIRYSKSMKASSAGLTFLGLLVAGMSLWYSNSWFSIGFLLSLAAAVLLIYLVWKTAYDRHIAVFLGTFLSFQSFHDINIYLLNYKVAGAYLETDAYLLSIRLFGTGFFTLPIAIAFAALSLLVWWVLIKGLFKKNGVTQ